MSTRIDETTDWDAIRVAAALDVARHDYWEDPSGSADLAVRCHEHARVLGDDHLRARAIVVQGLVSLNHGHLRDAFGHVAEAERLAERADSDAARLEVAALKSQVHFFSGSHRDALQQAWKTIDLGERIGTRDLRIFARRGACLVLGNLEAPGFVEELYELLRLSTAAGDHWQIAISRNDIGHWLMVNGEFDDAEVELEQAIAIAQELGPRNGFALAVLHCTQAELRLKIDRPGDALLDAEHALDLLAAVGTSNPYLFGIATTLQVQALHALGHIDQAEERGERAVELLGDRVPQARAMVLEAVATCLREAGRIDGAYDALARGAAVERSALQELTEIQLGFERATQETKAARHEADVLAHKNRELEDVLRQLSDAHAELRQRNQQLEQADAQLREQALRDPLTGLHNRRHLTAVLASPDFIGALSVAVLDLDHFKGINDAFGHATGDQVLVRIASLLRAVVRGGDTIVRSGGEEFVVVMPATDAAAAQAVCERVCEAVRAETWQRIAPGLSVTVSVGLATGDDPDALARVADERLYAAKRAGRDRVVTG